MLNIHEIEDWDSIGIGQFAELLDQTHKTDLTLAMAIYQAALVDFVRVVTRLGINNGHVFNTYQVLAHGSETLVTSRLNRFENIDLETRPKPEVI